MINSRKVSGALKLRPTAKYIIGGADLFGSLKYYNIYRLLNHSYFIGSGLIPLKIV